MSRDEDKLIRQLSLLSFLLSRPRPFTAREVQESVEGYADMTDDTFARRFHGDRADLAKIGIEVGVLSSAETAEADASQLYYLEPDDFRLPGVEFSPAEQKALSLALAALDGRFAYARPLRLALTAISRGRQDLMQEELDHLPVVFAPDEDARLAGRQLSRLEDAVSRGKTVCFAYPSSEGTVQDRTVDPYSLFLIQGHWYLVGRDHQRNALRTFRVGRVKGTVRFPTEKPRDFTVPEDYEPEQYRARPPWLIGPVSDAATVSVGEDLAWWVKRLEPHVRWLADAEGFTTFSVPFADEFLLLSWLASLGGGSEVLEPPALRCRAGQLLLKVSRAHTGCVSAASPDGMTPSTGADESHSLLSPTARDARSYERRDVPPAGANTRKTEPIAPEHLARTMSLLSYLLDEMRPQLVTWQALRNDLGLTREEIEADLGLINLVNFGGGTYALTAESLAEGVQVTREVMADVFSKPARLSPAMAKALLLALDVVGDTFAVEGLESLSSVRDKVDKLLGEGHANPTVIVDEVMPPDPQIVAVLNRAILDRTLVEVKYFTTSRRELGERLVEPYLLFHSPDGWYLEAYCRKATAQRTFKLERICEARPTAEVFEPRAEMDLRRRRTGEIAPAANEAAWAIIAFHPRWRTYLEERGTKCTLRPDGLVEASVPYLDELWIVQEVVRYLGDAVLESPASARDKIRETAAALAARYEGEPQAHEQTPPGGDA
jgi:predicted DNA-binding transcriptional regulator YafY